MKKLKEEKTSQLDMGELELLLSQAYVNEGIALSKRGMASGNHTIYEEALKYFDKAIALNPDCFKAYEQKGYVLTQLSRWEEGAENHRKMKEIRTHEVKSK